MWIFLFLVALCAGAALLAYYSDRRIDEQLRPKDYSNLEIPLGEPEIRMEVSYSKETLPVFERELSLGNPYFSKNLFDVATVTIFYNPVAKAAILKLGFSDHQLAQSRGAITDKKVQKQIRDAPHIYAKYGYISPYERIYSITPENTFNEPQKIWRLSNAATQTAIQDLQAQLKKMKDMLYAARKPPTTSHEI